MEIEKITEKKQKGEKLLKEEIYFAVNGFVDGRISKEQMKDFVLSIYNGSMDEQETFYLTQAMLESGQQLDLSKFSPTVDKHSTGGVSDSTTLIVVPLFALLGLNSLKMSGGALGHTGGTADKVRVFEGLNNQLDINQALKIVKKTGACFIVSSANLAPADKKIYMLRDEIGAVNSLPLIASSIMSKKLASGSENIILDVKFGEGALMKNNNDAIRLAKLMCKIGKMHGRNTSYVLGDMNQPLGSSVGNVMEVLEVIEVLKTNKNCPLLKHSKKIVVTCASKVLNKTKKEIFELLDDFISSGKALEKLKQIVKAQGGSLELFKTTLTPNEVLRAEKAGKLTTIKTTKLGFLDREFSKLEGYKGIKLLKRVGNKVKKDEIIAEIYCSEKTQELKQKLSECLEIE